MTLGRIQEERTAGVHQVVILPRRHPWSAVVAVFVFAWAGLFAAAIFAAPEQPTADDAPWWFIVIFLSCMALVCGLVVFNLLWNFAGRWELRAEHDTLTLTARLLRFRRSKAYAFSDIRGIRIHESRRRGGVAFRAIVFHAHGKKVHATPNLSEEEAYALMAMLFDDLVQ